MDVDSRIMLSRFCLTRYGEPIAISEYLLQITENEKTQVTFLQDDQDQTRIQP